MATATLPKRINYPTSDGKPMAETGYHVTNMTATLELLIDYFKDRRDVYVIGNIFVYYAEGDPTKRLSSDVFVSFGVPNTQRDSYRVWEEGKYPDFIIEFTSAKTRKNDTQKKFQIYQDIWKVREYFLFDPRADYLKFSPTGYRLTDGVYQPIENVNGRLTSEVLGFTLERQGHSLQFRDAHTGKPVVLESASKLETAQTELSEANREIELLKQQLAKLQNPSGNGH